MDWQNIYAYLEQRQGQLDGVVFSGGEPLLQPNLLACIKQVKALGYAVKLDTNGTLPFKLDAILSEAVLDYVAMDFKADSTLWPSLTNSIVPHVHILKSLALLNQSQLDYEIRITLVPGLHTHENLSAMAQSLHQTKRIRLQTLSGGETLDPQLRQMQGFTEETLIKTKQQYFASHPDCKIRV